MAERMTRDEFDRRRACPGCGSTIRGVHKWPPGRPGCKPWPNDNKHRTDFLTDLDLSGIKGNHRPWFARLRDRMFGRSRAGEGA